MGAAASTKVPKQSSPTAPVTLLPTQSLQLPVKLERLYLGLGWRNKGGASLDIDASAVSFSGNQVHNIVYFGNMRDRAAPSSAVVHTGDVLTGGAGKDVDLERIYFQCGAIAKEVDAVYLVINVFSGGKTFADVDACYCRLVNADSNQELANFRLSDLKTGDAIIFGKLGRHPLSGYWQWMALGQIAHGRTAQVVAQQIAGDARMVQPAPALPPVGGVAPAVGVAPVVGVAAVAVAAPAAAVQVQVPPGAAPGTLIAVQSPTGQMMQVQVPPGAVPGTVISVPVAGAAPAASAPGTAAPGAGAAPGAPAPQRPTKSLAAPALIGATALGVAAATAVFVNPGLSRDMLGGVDGGIDIGSMCDPSNISLPDDLIPVDLMDPGEVVGAFGDLAGNAVDGAGSVLVDAGDVAAGLAGDAGETVSGALSHLGEAVGNLDAGGIAQGLGEVMHNAGDAIAHAGGDLVHAAEGMAERVPEMMGNVGDAIARVPEAMGNIGDAIGNVGEGIGSAVDGIGEVVGAIGEVVGG